MSAKFPQFVRVFTCGVAFAAAGCSGSAADGDGRKGGGAGGGNGGSSVAFKCDGPSSVAAGRWRRLTGSQYANSVRDLIGQTPDTSSLVADSRTGSFKTNALLPVQENDVGAYDSLAQTMAAKAVTDLSSLLQCDTKAKGEDKCATEFVKTFGARAYRRPLTSDEEGAFASVYSAGKEESFTAGIRLVVQAMLSSPSFLYMVESGKPDKNGLRKLTGYEVASRLSYVLTGTMPDAELFSAARAGDLESADGVRDYAKKLLDTDKFLGVAQEFHVQLVGLDEVTSDEVSKAGKFPAFDDATRKAMLEESRNFVNYVMTKGDGSVEELLSAPYVFPANLSKIYGDKVKADGDGRAEITDGSRKGLLTLAGVQAVHPKQLSKHSAVNRGHLVRRDFLCETVPPPNEAVDFSLPPNAAELTAQELLREHQENPTCRACHKLMDSIGFGFESYDAVGAYRTKDEGGHTIDASGEIVGLATDGKFANAAEMAGILAKAPEVRACVSTQWLRFALGRDPADDDACSLQSLTASFSADKGNIKDAVLSLVSSDAFRFNRGQ